MVRYLTFAYVSRFVHISWILSTCLLSRKLNSSLCQAGYLTLVWVKQVRRPTFGSSCCNCCRITSTVPAWSSGPTDRRESSNSSTPSPCLDCGAPTRTNPTWTTKQWDVHSGGWLSLVGQFSINVTVFQVDAEICGNKWRIVFDNGAERGNDKHFVFCFFSFPKTL